LKRILKFFPLPIVTFLENQNSICLCESTSRNTRLKKRVLTSHKLSVYSCAHTRTSISSITFQPSTVLRWHNKIRSYLLCEQRSYKISIIAFIVDLFFKNGTFWNPSQMYRLLLYSTRAFFMTKEKYLSYTLLCTPAYKNRLSVHNVNRGTRKSLNSNTLQLIGMHEKAYNLIPCVSWIQILFFSLSLFYDYFA
jgi:hypothetical protein